MSLQSTIPSMILSLEFVFSSEATHPSDQLQKDNNANDIAGEQETIPELSAEDCNPSD